MQLAARQKEILFNDLAQLMQSGITFRNALEHITAHSSQLRHIAARMLTAGGTPEECFGAVADRFNPVDFAIVTAGVESGRLDQAFTGLGGYYVSIVQCQSRAKRALYYPLAVFHLGVLLLNLPILITGEGAGAYFKQVLLTLLVFYALCVGGYVLVRFLLLNIGMNAALQRHFRHVPLLGRIPYQLAVWRFSLITSLLIASGLGIYRALELAGQGCNNALVKEGAALAIAASREGAPLTEAFQQSDAFPPEILRHISLGEAAGRLDEEMKTAANEMQEKFLRGITLLSKVLPQVLYLGILLYLGWRVIALYSSVLGEIKTATEW